MTIKKVALEAGVSTATISRVINNTGVVQDETREKILRAIDKLGYKPSTRQQKRSSATSPLKHRTIALIWTGYSNAAFSETGREMVLGILHNLKPMGAHLTVDHITAPDHIPQCLLDGKIDGVLLHGPEPSPVICARIRKFPAVWLLQSGSVAFGDHVQPDHNLIGRLAAQHLIQQNCKQLCCISYTPEHENPLYWQSRAAGFEASAKSHNVNCSVLHYPETLDQPEKEEQAKLLIDLFKQLTPHPDGLFVANDLGDFIHRELMRRGITPMKDLPMIAGNTSVTPKTIDIDFFSKEIGQLSVDALLWRIKNPTMPIITHTIKPVLIIPQ